MSLNKLTTTALAAAAAIACYGAYDASAKTTAGKVGSAPIASADTDTVVRARVPSLAHPTSSASPPMPGA